MLKPQTSQLRGLGSNIYAFWLLLALPAMVMGFCFVILRMRLPYFDWAGELSCWLLIAAMLVTPVQLLFGPMPWLRVRRRYLGVASFGYALIHLVFWLKSANLEKVIASFARPEVLTGWIAFAIMLVMAATSFDGAVRKLGPKWKSLQRWVYPMAALTLAHWLMTNKEWTMILVYSGPLIALSIWRLWRYQSRIRST